jgi:hypothetical protein
MQIDTRTKVKQLCQENDEPFYVRISGAAYDCGPTQGQISEDIVSTYDSPAPGCGRVCRVNKATLKDLDWLERKESNGASNSFNLW